jgi:pyrimidine operon attenuation protein/uracil phosphoribosyltransferase
VSERKAERVNGTVRDDEEELLDAQGVADALDRLARAILERYGEAPGLCLVGVRRRGDQLALRLAEAVAAGGRPPPPCGSLDITLYRDDFDSLSPEPVISASDIPFPLDGGTVVLVDDVLFTGRTTRAALDELLDLGRPARVALVVLVDRAGRELPIAADLAGIVVPTQPGDDVQVLLAETDGRDGVVLRRTGADR